MKTILPISVLLVLLTNSLFAQEGENLKAKSKVKHVTIGKQKSALLEVRNLVLTDIDNNGILEAGNAGFIKFTVFNLSDTDAKDITIEAAWKENSVTGITVTPPVKVPLIKAKQGYQASIPIVAS
ncbi:MAG: hypothetical protein HY738_15200 [Bacteroidia bacterium]|nr:hypothetical protein [Bacteroidia bacterium]